ncbi:hypothetical protein D3C78_1945380 [compost metagenome]
MLALTTAVAKRVDSPGGIFSEPLQEITIKPGFGHHTGAIARANPGLVSLDDLV